LQTAAALKAIEKAGHPDTQMMKNEIDILMKVAASPRCMDLKAVFEDSRFVWLASSLYSGGELFDAIVDRVERGESYTEMDAARIVGQVMEAVKHCHEVGVAHRDIKPENILLRDADGMEIVVVGKSKFTSKQSPVACDS
jgi:serine/threonine protein kinase